MDNHNINPCHCGNPTPTLCMNYSNQYVIQCWKCLNQTAGYIDKNKAIEIWNELHSSKGKLYLSEIKECSENVKS